MQAGLRFATLLGIGSWARVGHVGMPYNTILVHFLSGWFVRLWWARWHVSSHSFGSGNDDFFEFSGTLACLITLFWLITWLITWLVHSALAARWHARFHSLDVSYPAGSSTLSGHVGMLTPLLFDTLSSRSCRFPGHGLGTLACLPSFFLMLHFFVLAFFFDFMCCQRHFGADFGARWQAYCPFVIVWRA